MVFRYEDVLEYANFVQDFSLSATLAFKIFIESESN